jgi:hypothetical protein
VTLAQAQAAQPEGGVGDAGSLADVTTVTAANCAAICDAVFAPHYDGCYPVVADGGEPAAACVTTVPCHTGRAPAGLTTSGRVTAESDVGAFLAHAAHLEAASVHAFVRMAAELEAHGAPEALLQAAKRAAMEEVQHARLMTDWARSHGAEPVRPRVEPGKVRDLEAILAENAAEGCVRETFGAVLAAHQSLAAQGDQARRRMARIARDETSHAELSWEVARWGERRLDRAARARVSAARDRAVAALRQETGREPTAALRRELGLPRASEALAMFERVREDLWS